MELKLKNSDYSFDTKNLLVRSASWIVNKGFVASFESKFSLPLSDHFLRLKQNIQENINHSQFSDQISISGEIIELVPEDIFLTPQKIKVIVNANGYMNLSINKF